MKYRVTSDFFCSYFYHAGTRQSHAARDHVQASGIDVEAVYASMAAVVLLQGALESYINFVIHENGLSDRPVSVSGKDRELSKAPVKDKWRHVAPLLCGQKFAEDRPPYADFAALVDLRNKLVHFKAQQFSCEVDIPPECTTPDAIGRFLSRPGVLADHVIYDVVAVGIAGPGVVRGMVETLHSMMGTPPPHFLETEDLLIIQRIH